MTATRTPTRGVAKATTAVAPAALTPEQITAILQEKGFVETPGESEFNRIKVDGLTFYLGQDMYVSNPRTGEAALVVRILDIPVEYQAIWLTPEDAAAVGRPGFEGFCKSHFDEPNQARKFAEDGTPCGTCPINPFVKKGESPLSQGRKCSWKGDIQVQVLDENGQITDETEWTLTLSTTAMIEWKGTAKEPEKGHTPNSFTFMHQLATLGATTDPENPHRGINRALTSLRMGGVIAELRAVPAASSDGARRYNVIQFRPINILDMGEDAPALGDGVKNVTPEDDGDTDDLPF